MVNLVPSPKRLNGSLLQPDAQGRKTVPTVSTTEPLFTSDKSAIAPCGHHCGARPDDEHVREVTRGFSQAPKSGLAHPIPIHGSMTSRQHSLTAMGHAHATAPDAGGADALSPGYVKDATKQQGVPIYPGMRSRTSPMDDHFALGAAILNESVKSGSTELPLDIGKLPS